MDKEDVVHIYNVILLSHLKEWNNTIFSNMDGPRDCHTEWNKSDKGEISYGIPYMWNIKGNYTNELTKEKETHRLRKETYGCGGGWGAGIVMKLGMDMYTLLYLK